VHFIAVGRESFPVGPRRAGLAAGRCVDRVDKLVADAGEFAGYQALAALRAAAQGLDLVAEPRLNAVRTDIERAGNRVGGRVDEILIFDREKLTVLATIGQVLPQFDEPLLFGGKPERRRLALAQRADRRLSDLVVDRGDDDW
jgi:hypothetical protein